MATPAVDSFESLFEEAVCGLDSALCSQPTQDWLQPSAGSIVAERYRIGPLIGRGGMGCVYHAEHLLTGKRVAIKWLRGDQRSSRDTARRMMREARAAGQIQHPNVVDVYDAGSVEGHPYIVMELIEGESLEERLRRSRLEIPEAIDCILQVMRGIAAAHAHGIVHRDLKPGNILLSRASDNDAVTVKVVDFGISKLLTETEADLRQTTRGAQIGTPMFMSPEQVRGDPLDHRADIYALAVTLFYSLTLRFPFEARTHGDLFAKVLTEPPAVITDLRPDVPHALAQVIARGLERDRQRRFASVVEMASAITDAASCTSGSQFGSRWLRALAVACVGTMIMAGSRAEDASAPVVAKEVASQPSAAAQEPTSATQQSVLEVTLTPADTPVSAVTPAPMPTKQKAGRRTPRAKAAPPTVRTERLMDW